MSDAESPRRATPIESLAAVAVILAVAAPFAAPWAIASWRWAARHADEPRRLARLRSVFTIGAAFSAVIAGRWYTEAWWAMTAPLSGASSTRAWWWNLLALVVIAPPVGLAAGMWGRTRWLALLAAHPINGRAHAEAEAERIRELRARHAHADADAPLVLDDLPVLGAYLDGDNKSDRWVTLPTGAAHIVAIGATGSGKTQSLLRLAAAHLALGWQVVVIDAKEDPDTARAFAAHARRTGLPRRTVRTWPQDGPMDLLRGDGAAVRDRLMATAAWTEPYYRAVASTLLTLVCDDPDGPPRSLSELVERLDPVALRTRWAGTPRGPVAAGIKDPDIQGVRFRFFSLAAELEVIGATSPDGDGWSWEDATAAWVTLPTSTRASTAGAFGRAALVDLIAYLRDLHRRDATRPILLIVEELGAVVSADPSTALLVVEALERARSARCRTVVSVQTIEGLGDTDARARILHGGAAVLAHRMPAPEPVSELAGTRWALEASLGVDAEGRMLDAGSVREQHTYSLPPDTLRRLPVGHAVLVHDSRWTHVAVPMLSTDRAS